MREWLISAYVLSIHHLHLVCRNPENSGQSCCVGTRARVTARVRSAELLWMLVMQCAVASVHCPARARAPVHRHHHLPRVLLHQRPLDSPCSRYPPFAAEANAPSRNVPPISSSYLFIVLSRLLGCLCPHRQLPPYTQLIANHPGTLECCVFDTAFQLGGSSWLLFLTPESQRDSPIRAYERK
jgi:hypothetical protein